MRFWQWLVDPWSSAPFVGLTTEDVIAREVGAEETARENARFEGDGRPISAILSVTRQSDGTPIESRYNRD